MMFDRAGTVLARRYRPFELGPGDTDEDLDADLAEAASVLVARLGDPAADSLPAAPLASVVGESSPLAWIDLAPERDGPRVVATGRQGAGPGGGWQLVIEGRTCRSMVSDSR